jgi:hypothetical protein
MSQLQPLREAPLLQALFAPRERWGWEYREPDAAVEPFPHPRPVLEVPWPNWAPALAARQAKAGGQRAAMILGGLLAVLLAVLVAGWQPDWALALLAVGGTLGYLGVAHPRSVRRQAQAQHRRWLADCVTAQDRYQETLRAWTASREEHRLRELERQAAAPEWAAFGPSARSERVDVYGGTAYGWEALVTSAGASMLGAGARLDVVDLSQELVAAELCQLAERSGVASDVLLLPEQMEELDLLGGLAPERARDAIVEALHGDEQSSGHEARSMDARVLGAVIERLGPPLTLARICAGLRVLLGEDPLAGQARQAAAAGAAARLGNAELWPEEVRRISACFGESFRKSAEPRMAALESRLHPLCQIGGRVAGRRLVRPGSGSQLQVAALTAQGSALVSDVLAHLLLQLLIEDARQDGGTPRAAGARSRVLMVIGADPLRRRHLERLAQLARRRGVRLVYLFRHLRDDATELLGGGTALFMRLGNANEATSAAEHIGREHRFVLHQLTRSAGVSVTHSSGDSEGGGERAGDSTLLRMLPLPASRSRGYHTSRSRAWGRSRGLSTGSSVTESPSYQRAHELVVEPHLLQSLPETAFLLVEPQAGRPGPRVRLGDCNPDILTLPRVAASPLEG